MNIKVFNVGWNLANEIKNMKGEKHLSLKVQKKLDKFLSKAIYQHDKYGNILALENLGILFEPELKIDFLNLIDNYSKNNTLFIRWDGEIENNKLFFLSKSKGIEININKLSHIIL